LCFELKADRVDLLRKLFVTLLTVSLLAGIFLAGAMPVMAAPMAMEPAAAAGPVTDCAHHHSQPKPLEQKHSGHPDPSCCVNGHCPMLGQALMPAGVVPQPSPKGSLLRPMLVSLHRGIIDSPHLRPPRYFL
jgi:hypothetical protein